MNIPTLGLPKERFDQLRQLLYPAQRTQSETLHFVLALDEPARDAAFDMGPDHFIGIQLRRVGGKKNRRSRPCVLSTNVLTILARWLGWPSTTRKTGPLVPTSNRLRNSIKTRAVTVPSCSMKRNSPRGLIAESMFSENRRPVTATTGVCPWGAQVVPVW